MKTGEGMWRAGGCMVAWAAMAVAQPLSLVGGTLDTASEERQMQFRLFRSSVSAPVVQRLTSRGTAPWLVQFHDVIREEWKTALEAAGATIHGYVPENAFLVEATPAAAVRAGAIPAVSWMGEYLPGYKRPKAERTPPEEGGREYSVLLFDAEDKTRIMRELGEMGAYISRAEARSDSALFRVGLTPNQVDEVAGWGEVQWIEPARKPRLWSAPALPTIGEGGAAGPGATGWTGKGQIIAACDTGIDGTHPDLAGRASARAGEGVRRGAMDTRGHGTFLAGIAIGDGAMSEGRHRGVAVEAEWIAQGMGPALEGLPGDLGGLLGEAYQRGARIHLNGWGREDRGAYGLDSRSVDQFVWNHPDMLVVVAAGNAATDTAPADGVVDVGSVGSPATAKNGMAVGASEGLRDLPGVWRDSWPEDFSVEPIARDRMAGPEGARGMAAFSGRGPCADGRIKPDVVAPGTGSVSTRSRDSADPGWGRIGEEPGYLHRGGTSVSAALAAGAAALARQWLAEERGVEAPSAALVKALLIGGARDLAPGQYGAGAKREIPDVRPNNVQGFGQLDVLHALRPGGGAEPELHDEAGLATGQAKEYPVDVPAGTVGRVVLTLAYSDYWAAPGAGKKLVNDLDLTVRTPSGRLLRANGRSGPDDGNNVEMIEWEADEAGTWVARVEARAVPMGGRQPYALVVRGLRTEPAPVAEWGAP